MLANSIRAREAMTAQKVRAKGFQRLLAIPMINIAAQNKKLVNGSMSR
jgi:hypothetical protein